MNRNVWLRTITSPIVCSIAGMWQARTRCRSSGMVMRVLLDARRVRTVRRLRAVARQAHFVGRLERCALCRVPWTSWQLEQVTPCVYITLCTKSLPCIRFLCAVPSGKMREVVSPELVLLELPEVA